MTRRTAIGTAMLAASWKRVLGANERLNIGVIGLGGRGTHLLNLVMKHRADKNDLEVVGLAEVYQRRLSKAASIAQGAKTYVHHEELLARPDVDAVFIAAPDHWHVRMAVDALAAGKDVYLEKPVTHAIEEGATLTRAVRGEVAALDAQLPVGQFRTMEEVRGESVSQPRFLMFLFSTFSIVALAIAVIGIYGVIAYGVAQRRKEIGIRVALGAKPSSVAGMVVRQGMALAGVGIVAGLVLAFGLTRFLSSFLFAVTPTDPITMVLVAATLAIAALAASYVPALRATRTNPVEVLRGD